MTRGPKPRQALLEAEAIAWRRGQVLMYSGQRGPVFDLIVFTSLFTIFIRVKRTRTEYITVDDILADCRRELSRLCCIPETAVVMCELWVRSPKGRWRYFLVTRDGAVEIPPEAPLTRQEKTPAHDEAAGPDRGFMRYQVKTIDVVPVPLGEPLPDRHPPVSTDPEPDHKPEKSLQDKDPETRTDPGSDRS
jgi:hypothetical protein